MIAHMYLRHTTRKKDGKVHCYWRLVRSVRVGRRVIQQTQLLIAADLSYIKENDPIFALLNRVSRLLTGLHKTIRSQ